MFAIVAPAIPAKASDAHCIIFLSILICIVVYLFLSKNSKHAYRQIIGIYASVSLALATRRTGVAAATVVVSPNNLTTINNTQINTQIHTSDNTKIMPCMHVCKNYDNTNIELLLVLWLYYMHDARNYFSVTYLLRTILNTQIKGLTQD